MRRDVGAPVQRNPTIVEHCKKICNMLKECDLLQQNFQTNFIKTNKMNKLLHIKKSSSHTVVMI